VKRHAIVLAASLAAACAALPACRDTSAPRPEDRVPAAQSRVLYRIDPLPPFLTNTFALRSGPLFTGTELYNSQWRFRAYRLQSGRLIGQAVPIRTVKSSWVSPQGNLYVCDGSLYRYDGLSWTQMLASARAVGGTSETDVYAVDGNRVVRFDGSAWNPAYVLPPGMPTASKLFAFPDGAHVLAVGDSVVQVRPDTVITWNMSGHVIGLWGTAWNNAYAIAAYGTTLRGDLEHYDGMRWTDIGSYVYAVSGRSATDVFILHSGAIAHSDGSRTDYFFTNSWRRAASMAVSDTTVWIGGEAGMVMQFRRNQIVTVPGSGPPSPTNVVAWSAGEYALSDEVWGIYRRHAAGGFEEMLFRRETSAVLGRAGPARMWIASNRLWQFDGSTIDDRGSWGYRVVGDPRCMWSDGGGNMLIGAKWGFARFDGSLWTAVARQEFGGTNDVWGFAANDLYALWDIPGVGSAIWHFDGMRWAAPDTLGVLSLAGTVSNNVYAVGKGGVWHNGGAGWRAVEAPLPGAYRRLVVHSRLGTVACTDPLNGTALLLPLDAPAPDVVRVKVSGDLFDFTVGGDGAFYILTSDELVRVEPW